MSAITTPTTVVYRAPLCITTEHTSIGGSWTRYFPEPEMDASHWIRMRIYTWPSRPSCTTLEWQAIKESSQIRHWAVLTFSNSSQALLDESFQTSVRNMLHDATLIRLFYQHIHPGERLIGATEGKAGKDGVIQSD